MSSSTYEQYRALFYAMGGTCRATEKMDEYILEHGGQNRPGVDDQTFRALMASHLKEKPSDPSYKATAKGSTLIGQYWGDESVTPPSDRGDQTSRKETLKVATSLMGVFLSHGFSLMLHTDDNRGWKIVLSVEDPAGHETVFLLFPDGKRVVMGPEGVTKTLAGQKLKSYVRDMVR